MTSLLLVNHRPAPTVEMQPTAVIRRWQVVKPTFGEALLVGVLPNGFTWRVTTPIVAFCASARCVTTRSGRRYELSGPPAVDALDLLVIDAHLALNQISGAANVSESYSQAIAGATQ